MGDYRRWFVPGGTFFFTLVTNGRRGFLTSDLARPLLRNALEVARAERPFSILAIVLIPDHFHIVLALPFGDSDYSTRMRHVKTEFTRSYLDAGGSEGCVNKSRAKRKERGIWQRRFWEHNIRDEDDLKGCVDYIHWNPRKHNLVRRILDYPWSSFHRYIQMGEYGVDWGGTDPCPGWEQPE